MPAAYPDLDALKAYLLIAVNDEDDLLQTFLDSAVGIIEAPTPIGTGRVFGVGDSESQKSFDIRNIDDGRRLWLPPLELVTFSEVLSDGTDITADVVTSPQFTTPYYALEIGHTKSTTFTSPVLVTGVWGYSADVPQPIYDCCLWLAAWLYRAKDGDSDKTVQTEAGLILPTAMPSNCRQVINTYQYHGFGG